MDQHQHHYGHRATAPFGRYDVIVTNAGGQASGLAGALLVGYEVYLPLIHK